MRASWRVNLAFLLLGLISATPVLAQNPVITATFQQGNRASAVTSGSTVNFQAASIGSAVAGTITVTYTGNSKLTFPSGPQLVGSPDFSIAPGDLPASLNPLEAASFKVIFTPRTSQQALAQFVLANQDITGTRLFTLNLTGTAAEVVLSYAFSTTANTITLVNGDTVPFNQTQINTSIDATLSLTNVGTAPSQINSIAITGDAFQLLGLPLLPVALNATTQLRFGIRFLPRAEGSATGSLRVLSDTGDLSIALTGAGFRTPFSYSVARGQAVTPLLPNGSIDLGDIRLGDRTSVVVQFRNILSIPVTLSTIAVTGDGLGLSEGPLLPLVLQPQDQNSVRLNFAPQTPGVVSGRLAIAGDSFTITARAIGPLLRVSYQVGGTDNPISPGDVAPFPSTVVGQSVAGQFTFTNRGTGPYSFITIAVTDPTGSFKATDLPALPAQLQPDESISFGVSFAPQSAGKISGTFDVNGSALIGLSGVAMASSQLKFTYRIGGADFPVDNGGVLTFPPTTITQTTTAQFSLTNTGSAPASVVSVGLVDTQNTFQLRNLPGLPIQIPPNQTVTFTVDYRPLLPGAAGAILTIDTARISLFASAPSPPPLPAYQFTGASGPQQPFQQPAIGISLSAPYPLDLAGTLALAVISDSFAQDPAVRFSSGGQTVAFTIPANQTQARFPGGANQIQFQTGSVAGSIIATPVFQTTSRLDLTPSNPATARFDIPKLAPVLLSARIGAQTNSSLVVVVSGYATTRSLQSFDFTFTGGANQVSATTDVSASSRIWFQSAGSESFGGQFTVDVPFAVQTGSSPSPTENLVANIRGISVRARNELGTSNTVQVTIP